MDNFTYTSPSGVTYDVAFNDTSYPHYDISLNGRWVQFALSKDRVAASVAHYENPGPDLGSPRD